MAKKKVKIELTFEEKQQQIVENNLRRLQEDYEYISEPTYKHNVGDSVNIGSLVDAIIDRVIDDGKFYVVDYTNIDNNYGNPIKTEHCKAIFMWTELRKTNNNNKISLIKNDDIRISYSQRRISSLLSHTYHFGFDIEPEYQRGLVWTLEDKVALIDSIFNNVDIGKFTFIKPDYIMDKTEVLDGKQRLTTILEYYEDRFEYKGYKFSDLSWKDRNHFESYSIAWGESSNLTQEQKLRYFIKLNTTGKEMDKSHLDKVKNMLKELEE